MKRKRRISIRNVESVWITMDDPVQTACMHSFCRKCIEERLGARPRCPVCRKSATKMTIPKPEEGRCPSSPSPPAAIVPPPRTRRVLDAKIYLMADLQKVRGRSRNPKVLVFTQFRETLSHLSALSENEDWPFRTLGWFNEYVPANSQSHVHQTGTTSFSDEQKRSKRWRTREEETIALRSFLLRCALEEWESTTSADHTTWSPVSTRLSSVRWSIAPTESVKNAL